MSKLFIILVSLITIAALQLAGYIHILDNYSQLAFMALAK